MGATVDGEAYSFSYDSNGVRKTKSYAGTTVEYVTDGTKILSEIRGTTYNNYYYDVSGAPMGMSHGSKLYSFKKNLQGDIIGIYDSFENLVVEYVYDAYGNVISRTGSEANTVGIANPFLYRGYYYDYDLGWYYLNSRYYDPVVGRFINADIMLNANGGIAGNNMFAYCNNNPVNFIDYTGMTAVSIYETNSLPPVLPPLDLSSSIPSFIPYSVTQDNITPCVPNAKMTGKPSVPNEVLQALYEGGYDRPSGYYDGVKFENGYTIHIFNDVVLEQSSFTGAWNERGSITYCYFRPRDYYASWANHYKALGREIDLISMGWGGVDDPTMTAYFSDFGTLAYSITCYIIGKVLVPFANSMYQKAEYYQSIANGYELVKVEVIKY